MSVLPFEVPLRFLDVLIVEILAAIPLCYAVAAGIPARWNTRFAWFCASIAAFRVIDTAFFGAESSQSSVHRELLRQISTVLPVVMSGLLVLSRQAIGRSNTSNDATIWRWPVFLLTAFLLPQIYQADRISRATEDLAQLERQSRLAEFVELGHDLQQLGAYQRYNEKPLMLNVRDVERTCLQMESSLQQLLPTLHKARLLAILGRRTEALSIMKSLSSGEAAAPQTCLLKATILEHAHNWSESEFWYQQASHATEIDPSDDAAARIRNAALKGLGFTRRKQARYALAEQAYQQLLDLDPTAATHFLIAQFYEDVQAGEQSAAHLNKAVELDQAHFGPIAAQMQARLKSRQFDCFRF